MLIKVDTKEVKKLSKQLKDQREFVDGMTPYFKQVVSDFEADAATEAPYRTGKLSASIGYAFGSEPLTAVVGVNDITCPYAKFVYFGTFSHTVEPKTAKALAFPGTGGMVFAKKAEIPARDADRFLDKTLALHKTEYLEDIEDGMQKTIEQQVKV